MKHENNSLLFSLLVSMNNRNEHEVTLEDLRYSHCPNVSRCQIRIYSLVIECLSKGMSYEEIFNLIDAMDENNYKKLFEDDNVYIRIKDEYKKLDEDARVYVKMKLKKDLNSRRNNELKNRGEI